MKQIKTFEGACKIKGLDPAKVLPEITGYPKNHQKALIGLAKLIIINEALNFIDNGKKNWKPDWDNYSEGKYYPWFYLDKPGFRLYDVYCGFTYSLVGSRLVYRTRKLAEYAAKQFEPLYRDIMVLQ